MTFYRVFPHDPAAKATERGGALYAPPGGANRIDNPHLYRTLYLAREPEAAIAESFGRFSVWRTETFVHANGDPYALATIASPPLRLFDLNDIDSLHRIGVTRPSDIVMRDRERTQAWARIVYTLNEFNGASWWSYYSPSWIVYGIWDSDQLELDAEPRRLYVTDPIVLRAASDIARHVVP